MSTLVLPDHNLIHHPPVVRRDVAPRLVNGCLVVAERDHVMVVPYAHAGGAHPATEVAAFAMTDDDFARTLLVAAVDFLPGILSVHLLN